MNADSVAAGRRSLLAVGVLILALALLIVAQSYLDLRRIAVVQGKALFLVGLCLAGVALTVRGGDDASGWAAAAERRPDVAPSQAVRWLFALSFVLAAIGAAYAGRKQPSGDTPGVWLASVFVLLSGCALQVSRAGGPRVAPRCAWQGRRVAELSALAGIIGLALWLRVVDLASIPAYVNVDEASHGIAAQILRDGRAPALFESGFADIPRLSWAPVAVFLSLPGDELASLRLSSALTSMITFPLLYLTARLVAGRATALLATFLLAVAVVDINYARQGIDSIQNAPLTVGTVYFLLRTIRWGKRADAAACGVVGGLSLYSYFPSRALPFMIAVVLVYMMVRDRARWSLYVRLGVVILAAAVVVFAPQLGYYVTHPQAIIGHTTWHMWWKDFGDRATLWARALHQLDRSLWGFTYYADTSFHYGRETRAMDALTGILFFLGFTVCLRRWRQPGFFALAAWLLVMTFFVCFLSSGTPSTPRMCGLIPVVCLMAALGARAVWETLGSSGRAARTVATLALFVVAPAAIVVANYNLYFVRVAQSYQYDAPTRAARYLQQAEGTVTAYMVGADVPPDWATVTFLAPKVAGYAVLTWESFLPVRQPPAGDAVFIMGDAHAPALSTLREYYPNGEWREERTPQGRLIIGAYRVSGAEIAAQQGLMGTYRTAGSGEQVVVRKDSRIAFNWAADRPAGFAGEFVVQWDGSLYAPDAGVYTLRVEGSGEAVLTLDGAELVRKTSGSAAAGGSAALTKGWHTLHVDCRTSGGTLQLVWTQPSRPSEVIGAQYFSPNEVVKGLRATYYAGSKLDGAPALQVIEPGIYGPASAFTVQHGWQPYAARWTGDLSVSVPGNYAFAVAAFEGSLVFTLDGQSVISFDSGVADLRQGQAVLAAGQHAVEITFISPHGRTERLEFLWRPPGAPAFVPVPPSVLQPSPN